MDPLSLTASIIAVLQLSATLATHINNIRHATSDQKKVAVEASNLYSLLTNLRFRVEEARSHDAWFNQVKLLGVDNGPLAQFKHILEKMVEQISPSTTRDRVKSALTWKWTKSEVDDALKQMERLKTLITIALTNDAFTLSQAIHSEVAALTRRTSELQIGVEQLKTNASRDLQDRLSRWLQVPDPSSNYQTALAKRHAQTGSWLLQSPQLQDWKKSTSSFLWLHGNAGCGKTVLSATALQNILDEVRAQPDAAVAYFYFDFNSTEKQHTRNAIRSLLFQLALQLPDYLDTLEQSYHRCNNGQQQPSEDTVLSMLDSALASSHRKYIVLDALDECTERESMLPFIHDLVVSSNRPVCLLATSRRERDIEEVLKPVAHYVINIQSAQVDIDISTYVQDRLATDMKLKKWPSSVKIEVANELKKKANGMFRWAYCQLESLRNCVKLSALRKALTSLPKTLDETYARILRSIELNDQLSDAIIVLQWLCFSNRPLRLSEMVEVLAIQVGKDGGFDPEERLPDPEDVMVICSSLISCTTIERYGEQGNVMMPGHYVQVQLAHFSVKEYLLSERCSMRSDFDEPMCQQVIAEVCLHYLHYFSDQNAQDSEMAERYRVAGGHPLVEYAARNWWRHAAKSDTLHGTTTLELAMDLLTCRNKLFTWVRNVDESWSRLVRDSTDMDEVASPLYYAASVGLLDAVTNLLRNGADVNASGGRFKNTALEAASRQGHEKIVQVLLENGANINALGGGNTALHSAAWHGQNKIVQMLLEYGAEVNICGELRISALQYASGRGREEMVQMLLEHGADVNALGDEDTALQIASMLGYERIVQMLLEYGANVNALGIYGDTALGMASEEGYQQIVQILLENGADVNTLNQAGDTALQLASKQGHQRIVQILLDHGATFEK